jgi:plasmid stabilization system protein ParE
MSLPVRFHEAAAVELAEAAGYYDLKSPGLGGALIDAVELATGAVAKDPEAAPAIRGHVRKRLVIKFPYALLYSVVEDEIRVLAVAHQRRRPFYWRGRK